MKSLIKGEYFPHKKLYSRLFLLLNRQQLNRSKLLSSRIHYHRRSEFTEKISHRLANRRLAYHSRSTPLPMFSQSSPPQSVKGNSLFY